MPMEGWVNCLGLQNTSGVSGVNFVAAASNTIEVDGESFRCNKTTEKEHSTPPRNEVIYIIKKYVQT